MPALSRSRALVAWAVRAGGAVVLVVAIGCAPDSVTPPPTTNVASLFWGLTLDQHAVNLSTVSPYDTLRLTATPRTYDGSVLTGVPRPTYTSTDLARVQIDSTGLIRVIAGGQDIPVVATLRVGNITHTDTALVSVTTSAPPPPIAGFSIQPVAGDSARWEANRLEGAIAFISFGSRAVTPHDTAGNPIGGLGIYFASSDTTVATIDRRTGELNGIRPGKVMLRASTTAYGTAWADSVPFTITMPAIQTVLLVADTSLPATTVDPASVTITAGGIIVFFDYSRDTTSVIFDTPANVAEDDMFCFCGGGSVPSFGGDTIDFSQDLRSRSFPVAGTYVFHSTHRGGATGTIVVAPAPATSGPSPTRIAAAAPVLSTRRAAGLRRASWNRVPPNLPATIPWPLGTRYLAWARRAGTIR